MIRSKAILATCCMALLTVSFSTAGPAMCMPAMAEELHLDYPRQGLLFSAVMWSVPLSLAVAVLADRIGFRALLVTSSAVQAGGWFLLAGANSYAHALGGAFVLGLGGSIAEPLLTPLVCAIFPQSRTRMTNFLHAFYCVGIVCIAVLVMELAPAGLSWRGTFRILGLGCLPHGLAALLLPMPARAHDGLIRMPLRGLLGCRVFWLLAGMILLGAAAEMGPADWLPTFVHAIPGVGEASAGLALAAFGSLMATGRFLTAALGGRIGVRGLLRGSAVFSCLCLAAVALPLPPTARAGFLCLVGLGVACFWPTLMAAAGDRFPQAGAAMFSVLSFVGSTGCAAVPIAVGFLGQRFGSLAPALALLAVLPAILLVGSFLLNLRTRQ
ncbi:MAG: MFS transporter [Planctomycetota bacterium]